MTRLLAPGHGKTLFDHSSYIKMLIGGDTSLLCLYGSVADVCFVHDLRDVAGCFKDFAGSWSLSSWCGCASRQDTALILFLCLYHVNHVTIMWQCDVLYQLWHSAYFSLPFKPSQPRFVWHPQLWQEDGGCPARATFVSTIAPCAIWIRGPSGGQQATTLAGGFEHR